MLNGTLNIGIPRKRATTAGYNFVQFFAQPQPQTLDQPNMP